MVFPLVLLHIYFSETLGAHFAEVLIYLSITGILATFDISKEVQEDGLEITPKLEFTTGITRYGLDLSTLF